MISRVKRCSTLLAGLVVAALRALPLSAQVAQKPLAPEDQRGLIITSTGQPSPWSYFAAGDVGLQPISERLFAGQLSLGVQRSLLNPVATVAQITGEYFMGIQGQAVGMIGVRAGMESPLLHIGGGWQYEFRREEHAPYFTIRHPLRRSGVFWPGGEARLRWVAGKDPSIVIGVTAPLARPFAGKTRPKEVKARVPLPFAIQESRALPQSSATREAFAVASSSAQRIARLYVPYLGPATENALSEDGDVAKAVRLIGNELGAASSHATTSSAPANNLPIATVREYHRALEAVFVEQATQAGLAASDYATAARKAILDEVLFPYNRFLGRKKGSDTFQQLAARARIAFLRDLVLQRGMDRSRIESAESVFSQLLGIIQVVEKRQRTIWDDDRLSYLPLQLALLPEEHDAQAEIDALLGRAIETPFTGGNKSWYVVGEQFEWELIRMLHDTRKYHVLWIHDFRGQDAHGDPDAVSYQTVVKGYFDALTNRIEAYDREGGLPVYMIFIDQWFYEVNNGKYWLELLEDPMRHKLKLPKTFEPWAVEIRAAQERLKRAVANSRMLQAEAREYGEEWLYNRVRVQVNVTNPADPTFASRELMPWIGLPDAMIRDHRKIAFFDVDPRDATRGRALYTGMGVGEHYNGATWDDRAMMVEGPALRSLRRAARDLLLQQGLTDREIPFPLQDTDVPEPVFAAADASAVTPSGMMLDAHNMVGYGDKRASVLKATMYNLMPTGTVAKTPDSLWNFPLWGSLLTGLALRGGKVMVIAPSFDNAPAQAFGSIALARNVLGQVVRAGHDLKAPIDAAGGLLKVGMYKPKSAVGDIPGRTREVAATFRVNAWFRELDGITSDEKGLDLLADSLEKEGFKARYLDSEGADHPKLHMKAQLFVTAEGWNPLKVPESKAFLLAYLRQRAVTLSTPGNERDLRMQQEALAPASRAVGEAVRRGTTPADRERAAYYLLVGSHNQNFRSAVLDGEVLVAVSGDGALVALADFTLIEGLSEWIETPKELEPHFPSTNAFLRVIANWGRVVF